MSSPERQFNVLVPDQNPQNTAADKPKSRDTSQPIQETESSISYLGVGLEKAEVGNSQFVPAREQYRDFINDKEISLPLQRDIAVSFLGGDPLLVEGGTSLGKTTTVKKMAAELGWEVHYANLNGATDVEDLMGRYIPNPNRSKLEDPEYIFADGKVTSGLRQEEGKTKVVILDEFNASAPNILIRLHEVLDSLERGGDVILSEDASEAVKVDKNRTKVIALMNPPGKGFLGREPLDPAQLRRWVYKKMPTELPAGTFSYSTDALFGAESETQNITPDMFLNVREDALTPEQLPEIPGMREILEKYKEFHKGAKELLKNRKLAEDQPQPFTYDDRMEPRRVRDFVLRFYSGDINETFQQALRYYYTNKLESEVDRAKLGELIRQVEYKPKVAESKRRGAERDKDKTTAVPKVERASKEDGVETSIDQAREIMGADFYGPEEIANTFGIELKKEEIPGIPYNPEDLVKAAKLGEKLILRISHDSEGNPMTMQRMNQIMDPRLVEGKEGRLLYDTDWYKNESFYINDPLKLEWRLVGGSFVPDVHSKKDKEGKYTEDSRGKNYVQQTRLLRDYLKSIDSLTEEEETQCSDDNLVYLAEKMGLDWETGEITDQAKYEANWKRVALELSQLSINLNHRRSPAEIIYDFSLQFNKSKDRGFLENNYDWSRAVSFDGALVDVGRARALGASVDGWSSDDRYSLMGVVSLR